MSVILFIIAVILFMFAVAFQSISERKWGKTYDYTHLCRNYKIFWILTGIAILLSISALALIFSENKQDYSDVAETIWPYFLNMAANKKEWSGN